MPNQSTCRILLVEDNPGDARLFEELLRGGQFESFLVEHADRLSDAIARLQNETYNVVVLDLSLPDAVGLKGLDEILLMEPSMPVVVISGLVDEDIAVQAVRAGAQDYLLKGHIDELLLARCLRYAIERGQLQKALTNLAQIDDLTGLVNRSQFNILLENAIHQTKRSERMVGLLLIDLDGFKAVNDTFGHPIGDKLLKITAQRLLDCARSSDSVARLGGDEFAVIATNNESADGIAAFAQRIIDRLSAPFTIDGNDISIGASVGINIYPNDSNNADGLLRHADIALYRAKDHGRGNYKMFDEDMDQQVRELRSLEADLRTALAQGEIELFYQPQFSLTNSTVVGMEALMRWRHPQRGQVSPGETWPRCG